MSRSVLISLDINHGGEQLWALSNPERAAQAKSERNTSQKRVKTWGSKWNKSILIKLPVYWTTTMVLCCSIKCRNITWRKIQEKVFSRVKLEGTGKKNLLNHSRLTSWKATGSILDALFSTVQKEPFCDTISWRITFAAALTPFCSRLPVTSGSRLPVPDPSN